MTTGGAPNLSASNGGSGRVDPQPTRVTKIVRKMMRSGRVTKVSTFYTISPTCDCGLRTGDLDAVHRLRRRAEQRRARALRLRPDDVDASRRAAGRTRRRDRRIRRVGPYAAGSQGRGRDPREQERRVAAEHLGARAGTPGTAAARGGRRRDGDPDGR